MKKIIFLSLICSVPLIGATPSESEESQKRFNAIVKSYEEKIEKDPNNFRLILAVADVYYSLQEYAKAVKFYRMALKLRPDDVKIQTSLAQAYLNNDDRKRSQLIINEVLKKHPDNVEALSGLARLQTLNYQFAEADKTLETALKLDPKHFTSLFYLASLRIAEGRYDTAKKILEQLVRQNPSTVWVQQALKNAELGPALEQVEELEQKGNYQQALFVLSELQKKDPDSVQLYKYLAQVNNQMKRYSQSIELLNEGIGRFPKNMSLRMALGFTYLAKNDLDMADYIFKKAIEQGVSLSDAQAGLGRIALLRGNKNQALKLYQISLELNPTNILTLSYIADLLLADKNYQEAIEVYNQILKINPKAVFAKQKIEEALMDPYFEKIKKEIDLSRIETIYEELLRKFPHNPTGYLQFAEFLRSRENYAKAILVTDQGILINHDNIPLIQERALNYLLKKEFAKALSDYNTILAIQPQNVEALSGVGRILSNTGDIEGAEKLYLESLKIDPNNQTALNYLLDLKLKQKAYLEAAELAQSVMITNPQADWAREQYINARWGTLFDEAESLQKEGRLQEALKVLETIQKQAPSSERVYIDIGSILTKEKRYKEAIKIYREGIDANPQSDQLYINLGLIYLELNQTEEARFLFNQALRKNPRNADAIAGLGKTVQAEGNEEKAKLLYLSALDVNPNNLLALSYLASYYMLEHDYESAEQIYKKITTLDPKAVWARLALLESRVQSSLVKGEKGRFSAYASIYLKLIEEYPNEPEAYVLLAKLAIKMNQPEDAIKILNQGLKVLPDSNELKNTMGLAYIAQGNLTRARTLFEDILKIDPENIEALNGRGRIEELSGGKSAAIAWYEKALKINPSNFQAGTNLANLYYDRGQYAEAEELYKNMQKLQPQARWLEIARLDAKHGKILREIEVKEQDNDIIRAAALYDQLLQEEPKVGEYYLRAALFFARHKEYQRAIDTYIQGIKVEPGSAELHAGLGLSYLSLKKTDLATAAFEQALVLDPQNVDSLAGLGVVKMLQDQYGESEKLIRTAMNLDPKGIAPLSAFGDLMMKKKNYKEAERAYRKLLKLRPDEKWVKLSLDTAIYGPEIEQIKSLIKKEQFSEAADIYSKLLQQSPDNPQFYYGLGQMLMRLRDYGKSMEINQEGLDKNPESNELRIALAFAQLFSGMLQEAKVNLSQALDADRKNPEALAGLGRVYALEGNPAQAESLYRTALTIDPRNISALSFYSQLLMKQRRYGEAEEIYTTLLQDLPNDEWVLHGRQDAIDGPVKDIANRLANFEEFELAARLYAGLLEASPDDPTRYLALGQMYVDLDCYCKGLEVFYRGLQIDNNAPYLWHAIAETYIELEEYEKARCILSRLLWRNPEDAEAWAGLGRIEAMNGSYCAAECYYGEALTLSPSNLNALSFYADLKEDEHYYFSSRWTWKQIYTLFKKEMQQFCEPIPKWVKRGYNNTLNLSRPVMTWGGWYHEEDEWSRIDHRWSAKYQVYGGRFLLNYPVNDNFSFFGRYIDQLYVLRDLLEHTRIYSFDVQRLHLGAKQVFSPCLYAFGQIGFSRYSPYQSTTFKCQTHTLIEPSITLVYHTPIQKATLSYLAESDLVARNFSDNHAKLVGYDIIAGTYERKVMKRGWAGLEANATWYRDYVNNKSQKVLGWFQWRPPCYSDNILFRYFAKYQSFSQNIPDYYTYKPQIVNQLQVTLEKDWRIRCADKFYTSLSYGHGWQNTRTRFSEIIVVAPTVANPPIRWDNRQYDIVFGSLIYKYNCLQVALAGDLYRDSEKYTIGTIGLDVSWRF
ncbi:tetratricopeptide repeat protein [Estrella lausannensis]|uniref:Uncharacterized protein n=1 Tax=Estrella lausannensis TaxID=483423 RepID=A0A0H5DP35_9BACT|nr:tetratricopeptide repeat protein [Estrella lausannensis]CRX38107.1 hypothetical protein ELAC_0755 [Estrella lausannensis]